MTCRTNRGVSLQFGSNSFYQKLLNETRPRKPAPPPLAPLATPQKNTLCSFHFARAGFLFLLMKRVFFCGVLPSKYSGRWRDWPHFDFAKEKRNSPQTLPLFLCSNGTGTEAGGQKFLPPNPLPFCPPAWASPSKLSDGRNWRLCQFHWRATLGDLKNTIATIKSTIDQRKCPK